jgi:hypothetical protein
MSALLYNNVDSIPLLGFKIYKFNGKKISIKSRCELCAFADIDEDMDQLVCSKTGLFTLDNAVCNEFNITQQMMQDIYQGCIK